MSAEPRFQDNLEESQQPEQVESGQDIAVVLRLLFRLPDEAIENIRESARTLRMSFGEAALHTGLITRRERDQAIEHVTRPERNSGRSIVEEALKRHSTRRDVAVWAGARV